MKNWEYTRIGGLDIGGGDWGEMDEKGAEGWEAVGLAYDHRGSDGDARFVVLLKRPVPPYSEVPPDVT